MRRAEFYGEDPPVDPPAWVSELFRNVGVHDVDDTAAALQYRKNNPVPVYDCPFCRQIVSERPRANYAFAALVESDPVNGAYWDQYFPYN